MSHIRSVRLLTQFAIVAAVIFPAINLMGATFDIQLIETSATQLTATINGVPAIGSATDIQVLNAVVNDEWDVNLTPTPGTTNVANFTIVPILASLNVWEPNHNDGVNHITITNNQLIVTSDTSLVSGQQAVDGGTLASPELYFIGNLSGHLDDVIDLSYIDLPPGPKDTPEPSTGLLLVFSGLFLIAASFCRRFWIRNRGLSFSVRT